MNLSILYRGPLSSCNYTCSYCPFAKTRNSRKELEEDAARLGRFTQWVAQRTEDTIGILFTPWGEGLIRGYYQKAMRDLSHKANVRRVAIQTNLSCKLQWLAECNLDKVALWTTWHPTQVSMNKFLRKCRQLDTMGVRYSVGVVGLKQEIQDIELLRRELSPDVYLWVNAFKRAEDYYYPEEVERILAVDPLFSFNLTRHNSLGEPCRAGESVFSVNGEGDMYRCHFIKTKIGNIYEDHWRDSLLPRTCTNATCGCYIGYVHMNRLNLYEVYGDGVLERIAAGGDAGADH